MTMTMTKAISLDLETLGTGANAAIASIGACRFDPHSPAIDNVFHVHVSLENCQRHGLAFDASTLLWWLGQDEDARRSLIAGQEHAAPLITALDLLAAFIADTGEDADLWVNGASFDLPILANAYRVAGMPLPWKFWAERDLRTLKNLHRGAPIPRDGIHHNALHDAIHQARLIQHILTPTKESET